MLNKDKEEGKLLDPKKFQLKLVAIHDKWRQYVSNNEKKESKNKKDKKKEQKENEEEGDTSQNLNKSQEEKSEMSIKKKPQNGKGNLEFELIGPRKS